MEMRVEESQFTQACLEYVQQKEIAVSSGSFVDIGVG
jgi:hypothetical protein